MSDDAGGLYGLLGQDGLIVLLAGGAFIAVAALLFFITPNNRVDQRIKAIVSPSKRGEASAGALRKGSKAPPSLEALRDLSKRLNLLTGKQALLAAEKLAQAGWRSKDAVVIYAFARLLAPIATGGLAAFMLFVAEILKQPTMTKMLVVMIAVLVGFMLPGVFVKNMVERRKAKLRKALPDALDLLVICSEAGLSLDAGVARVAREFANSSVELAEELSLMSFELGFLPERRMAFDAFRKRVDIPAVHSLCSTLEQTERFGTPLAQALRVLSTEQRQDRMMRAEERAARLPAIMTVPLIIFILPALVVVVMGPAMLRIIDAFSKV
ncbi:MAG: type II secretion system F family protein [Alphaproteobacteria bacterium]